MTSQVKFHENYLDERVAKYQRRSRRRVADNLIGWKYWESSVCVYNAKISRCFTVHRRLWTCPLLMQWSDTGDKDTRLVFAELTADAVPLLFIRITAHLNLALEMTGSHQSTPLMLCKAEQTLAAVMSATCWKRVQKYFSAIKFKKSKIKIRKDAFSFL